MEKTAIITGGSSGIGAACAIALAKNGYNIALCYNSNKAAAQAICNNINSENLQRARAFYLDVSDEASVIEMTAQVMAEFKGIDALVNSAGIALTELFTDTTIESWHKVLGVNLTGTFLCCKAVLPHMISKKSGKIINISSIWGQVGASCEVAYSAAKAGVIGLTKALAKEEGPSNITVNCVAPGATITPMLSDLSAEDLDAIAQDTPLCRIGNAEDVADAVSFLLSDKAGYITGQVIGVSGGFVI